MAGFFGDHVCTAELPCYKGMSNNWQMDEINKKIDKWMNKYLNIKHLCACGAILKQYEDQSRDENRVIPVSINTLAKVFS